MHSKHINNSSKLYLVMLWILGQVSTHLFFLTQQMRWLIPINIFKHGIQRWLLLRLGLLHRGHNRHAFFLGNPSTESLHIIFINVTPLPHKVLQSHDGVALLLPPLNFSFITVLRGIITGAVMRHAVRHGLDQHRRVFRKCQLLRSERGRVDCKDIVPVHTNARNAVSRSPTDDPIRIWTVLRGGGRGDGVSIVATEKHHGCPQRRGKVTRGVEIALAGRSLAKIHHRTPSIRNIDVVTLILQLHAIGCTNGVRKLCAQRTANRVEIERFAHVMHWHLAPSTQIPFIGETLIGELLQCKAAPHEYALFAVLTEYGVFQRQGGGGTNVYGLLAAALEVERNATLALCGFQYVVHGRQADHAAVHFMCHCFALHLFHGLYLLVIQMILVVVERNNRARSVLVQNAKDWPQSAELIIVTVIACSMKYTIGVLARLYNLEVECERQDDISGVSHAILKLKLIRLKQLKW
mmetsp:Transcript_19366/g.29878  ORF Transcript_19366/g.29878 Transcript_19366/m.29878 type:complete len:465 (-) Transcript_19366:241-1635(-)